MTAVTAKLRVLLVNASPIDSACIAAALSGSEAIECTSASSIAASSSEAIQPEVILIAIEGVSGASACAAALLGRAAEVYPGAPTLILSEGLPSNASALLGRYEICGWLTEEQSVDHVTAALTLARAGLAVVPQSLLNELRSTARLSERCLPVPSKRTRRKAEFTGRQAQVVNLLMEGLSNKGIAYRLGTTESAVKNHLHSIMIRTGVMSRTQLILTLLGSS